ncbi:unnamed protein product, partial [Closterium sp. NIES-54]
NNGRRGSGCNAPQEPLAAVPSTPPTRGPPTPLESAPPKPAPLESAPPKTVPLASPPPTAPGPPESTTPGCRGGEDSRGGKPGGVSKHGERREANVSSAAGSPPSGPEESEESSKGTTEGSGVMCDTPEGAGPGGWRGSTWGGLGTRKRGGKGTGEQRWG